MKPIWEVDNVDDLLEFVVQDLKDLGIKVPKAKKEKSATELSQHNKSNVFGNYLCCLPCDVVKDCGHVPRFLIEAVDAIQPQRHTEGIFRKSGALSRLKELKVQIENRQGFQDAQLVDVTSLLKQFFRELPEPLLTVRLCDTFMKCYHLSNERNAAEAMLLMCLLLPLEHLSTLRYIMLFFSKIADLSPLNKMDPTNLAIVLSPSIMHMNNPDKLSSSEERLLHSQTAIVEFFIRSAPNIGMVTSGLQERAQLMLECFPASDVSVQSIDSSTANENVFVKRKKKRRSNSLQGFVTHIAQSIAKWRTNYSMRSHNISDDSGNGNESSLSFTPASTVTPQIRKRKASGDYTGFSSSKKQAILKQMPQNLMIGTPAFTPSLPSYTPSMPSFTPLTSFTPSAPTFSTSVPRKIDLNAGMSVPKTTSRKRLHMFSPKSNRKIQQSTLPDVVR